MIFSPNTASTRRDATRRREDRATLYEAMGPTTIVSGGSAANTIIGAASLGCRTAFVGRVKADDAGKMFAHDINGPRSILRRRPRPMVRRPRAASSS